MSTAHKTVYVTGTLADDSSDRVELHEDEKEQCTGTPNKSVVKKTVSDVDEPTASDGKAYVSAP